MSVVGLAVVESLDLILSGGPDCRLIVWRLTTGARIRVIEKAHKSSILTIVVGHNRVATGSREGVVKIWDIGQLATVTCEPIANPLLPWHTPPIHTSAMREMVMTD